MFAKAARQSTKKTIRTTATRKAGRGKDGVVEPDNRIVFAVLAIGMLVGALLTTPAKPTKAADLTTKALAGSK